jgi:hypothetical protein
VGQILDVNDADITDMVDRGCIVDEFVLEASGGASGIAQLTGVVTAGPGSGSQAAALAITGVVAGPVHQPTHYRGYERSYHCRLKRYWCGRQQHKYNYPAR